MSSVHSAKWFRFGAAALLFMFLTAEPAAGSAASLQQPALKKAIILSVPGLSFVEIDSQAASLYPHIGFLLENGAVGGLNTRTPARGVEDNYLTIGSGTFAEAMEPVQGFGRAETAEGVSAHVLYARYLGRSAGEAEIVVPEIARLRQVNEAGHFQADIGLLGETLKAHGVARYVLGNRDRGAEDGNGGRKHAPLMLMDKDGLVERGDVGAAALLPDPLRPFAVKTNYAYLLQELKKVRPPAVALLELGDLDRLYAERGDYSEPRFAQQKREILAEIDRFLGQCLDLLEENDVLWLFSPLVHAEAREQKYLLSPVIWYGGTIAEGLLTSQTTRRQGVIANIDLAPALLTEFGLPVPAQMLGLPARVSPQDEAFLQLEQLIRRMQKIYQLRLELLYPFVTYEVIVLLAALASAAFQLRLKKWLTLPLYSLLAAPAAMHWMGWTADWPVYGILLFFFTVMLFGSWILQRFPLWAGLAAVSSATVISILADGFAGAAAMKHSILGYDAMIGARYYGIGNEYMGALIGATLLAVSVFFQRSGGKYDRQLMAGAAFVFAVQLFYLASPALGTNAGGAITAFVAFGFVWVRWFAADKLRLSVWRWILLVCGLGIAAVAVLWLLNGIQTGEEARQSHIGRALELLYGGQFAAVGGLIVRKLLMNWHLLGVSAWSRVFITALLVLAVLMIRPRGFFHRLQNSFPRWMGGFSAIVLGAFVALLFNDSGIVAAATMIAYIVVPLLLIRLQEESFSHSS